MINPPPPVEPAPVTTPTPAPVATGTPRTDLIPRAVLFGNPERSSVRISPDGKWISWRAPKDGVMNVWVAPADKLDQAKAVTAETKRPIPQYAWAYTSKHILYMQDEGGDENFHVFKVDLADGKTTDLTPFQGARAAIQGLSEKQPTTLVVTVNDRKKEVFDLHAIDLVTGKRTLLVQNDDNLLGFTLDDKLAPKFAAKKLPDGATEWLVRAGKGWKSFDTVPFEDAESTSIAGIAPGGTIAYGTESRGRDTAAFVSIDLATKKRKVMAEDPKADVGAPLVHPTKHTIQAVSFTYDRTRWQVLDKAIAPDLAALGKLGGEVEVVSRSLDDKTWIVAISSDRDLKYYRWDRKKPTFLFAAQSALEKQPLVAMHPVVIKARDGLELVSYLSLPAAADPDGDGKANTPVPTVLVVHGGPWGRDEWGFNPLHQMLANRGYAALSVNFRGSTGFGKKFMNAGNLEWGKKMHDDLLDAKAWLVAQQVTKQDTVGILGGSYGGYAALAGLAITPDEFAVGVDIVGPSNLITLLQSIPPYWAPLLAMFKTRVGDYATPEGKALLVAASPLTHAANIKRPLLIGQGANDPRVKQAESEQIVAAMTKHKLPVTYVVFPDEGHGFHRPENNIAFWGVVEAFLSVHLGGAYLTLSSEEVKASTMQVKAGANGIPGLPR
ncbi:MAG: S9 family peptidase [Deltaproteobacteria bacterium]|nr:S9 family peptidase [Deltaproteobacteria bacterium]